MNIVLVIIDTLRYDHVGANGNGRIRTPNFDRLAADSWAFDRCFAASFPTIPHRTDVMTGEYGGPFHAWMPLRHDRVTFPLALAEAGYCTQLIHDTPHLVNGGHNFDCPFHAWTQVRGAEVDRPWIDGEPIDDSGAWPEHWGLDDLFGFAEPGVIKKSRMVKTHLRANRRRRAPEDWSEAGVFLKASEFLRQNASRDRFFLWIDCFGPHEPWDAPPEMMKLYDPTPGYDGRVDPRSFVVRNDERMTEPAKKRVAAAYAANVSWVDRWFGRFLDTLEETGLAKNTAVIFTADHGTKLGEYGIFGKGSPVREQEAHVPLFVRVPGAGDGQSDVFVQPQDIFATVAAIAGVELPKELPSHDVLKAAALRRAQDGGTELVEGAAAEGREGPRRVCLTGSCARPGWAQPGAILCALFDEDWWLEVAARPEDSHLKRYGSQEDEAAGNAAVVEDLHAKAVAELERRGADPRLMKWLRSGAVKEGGAEFPEDVPLWDGWPGPAGFATYFSRLYEGD